MTGQKNLDFPWSMEDTIENLKELKEILQEHLRRKNYEGQGERDVKEIALDFDRAIQALEEVEKYRALGTVEELKEAREKQVAKKPIIEEEMKAIGVNYWNCPSCKTRYGTGTDMIELQHCHVCGQKIDWEEGGTSAD